jgi:hypothetical protein
MGSRLRFDAKALWEVDKEDSLRTLELTLA